jgi:hypothetical protein
VLTPAGNVAVPITDGVAGAGAGKMTVAVEDVAVAFAEADKDCTGAISMEEIQAIEVKFGLPMDISIKVGVLASPFTLSNQPPLEVKFGSLVDISIKVGNPNPELKP